MNEERKIETEEVANVAPPPRARVSETFERKRDYLAAREALLDAVSRVRRRNRRTAAPEATCRRPSSRC